MKNLGGTTLYFLLILTMGWALGADASTTETPGDDTTGATVGEMAANETMDGAISADENVTMDADSEADSENGTSATVDVTVAPSTKPDSNTDPDAGETPDNEVDPGTDAMKPPDDDVIRRPQRPEITRPLVPLVQYVSAGPLCVTNADCNVTNAERCTKVKEEVKRCECLAGHSRGSDGYSCIASKVYYAELKTEQLIDNQLTDHSSSSFRKFMYEARDGAIRALQASKLSAILVDVRVSRLSTGPAGYVTVKYDVLLSRSYVPDSAIVTTDVRKAFLDTLTGDAGGGTVLEGTSIPVSASSVQTMELRDVNSCSHPMLNYCSPTALCVLSVRSFTCRCRRGYTDTSPDVLRAPGEQCTLNCGCKNGGSCVLDDQGIPKCSCPHWYLGTRCGIDVRIMLIILASVLGVLLLLAIVCCACCLKYWRKRHRQTDDISSVYSLPRERVHMHKLPNCGRTCYDTWRYYSFSPPTYNSASGGKWQPVAHRHHPYPPFLTCRRPDPTSPTELVPPGYATYGPIPRPHVLPSASLPRPNRGESQWVWSSSADQESSYA